MKEIYSKWIPEKKMLVTRLGGQVDLDDIHKWAAGLNEAVANIEPGALYKAFINLYSFKATDIEAHKAMRNVIPLTLARHGFKAGYVNLFEDAVLPLSNERGIRCVAAVHVHNDVEKMKLYQSRFNSDKEKFFTNEKDAEEWIYNFKINS